MAGPFDVITSRAFASLADFTRLNLLAPGGGVWMAMKGRHRRRNVNCLRPCV
jgi:16S rRNA (guanine527-N7)-methyltransferase